MTIYSRVNNGFKDYYYLRDDGTLYNVKKKCKIKLDEHNYKLATIDGKYKKISLKSLYKLVYGKNFCIDNIQDRKGEVWKEIENTNSIYYISNCGRVKSLQGYQAKILKPIITEKGYRRVTIVQNNISIKPRIHRLVAIAFLDEEKAKNIDYEVHHIDKNKHNNNLSNLLLLTKDEHYKIHNQEKKEL